MESLSLPILNPLLPSGSSLYRKQSSRMTSSMSSSVSFATGRTSLSTVRRSRVGVVKMQAVDEDIDLKQMRDMAAAKKRWDGLLREGKVKLLTPREAGYAIQLSNKPLLDVRPSSERNKAWVKGSDWVPIFDNEDNLDAGTLSKKVTSFAMGGWWSGTPILSFNKLFLSKVEEKFPKETELIVACQKGLRSLAACELLINAGYQNIFWVQGGLESAEDEDLVTEGSQPLKLAGIGGFSEFLGWTDQQRAQAAKEGWGYRLVFTARLFGVILAADALFLGAQQLGHYIQELRVFSLLDLFESVIMEMERVHEFPHTHMDRRPRKRARLGWDVLPTAPKAQVGMFCGQEIGNLSSFGAPSEISSSSLSVKTVARNDSPPWREDDKDGHYMFELGDDLTPRYKIYSKMGEGTFGQVLECWDRERKEMVAVKIVRGVKKYREAAMIEIEMLQQLGKHDKGGNRCVQIRNWFDYRNHICIVFEKLGSSLYDFLRKNNYRSFPIDLVREIGWQLLECVAFMHDLRMIHTDLKPENILLVSSDYVKIPEYKGSRLQRDVSYKRVPKSSAIKVIDFGSTTYERQEQSYIVSTRHYRAPEVILGLGWSYPCDVWSIGCIIVELCTGEALFQTHENLEHLAMMERVLGPLPQQMLKKVDRHAEKYVRRGRLDWPDGATSRDSLKAVLKLPRLQNLIMQHVDHSAGELINMVQGLLRFDPAERLTAQEFTMGSVTTQPLFSFGVIADVQYADIPDGRSFLGTPRYYRNSILVLQKAVQAWNQHGNLKFVINMGDIVDGFCPKDQSLSATKKLVDEFEKFQGPVYHMIGNHCLYNLPRRELLPLLNIPSRDDDYNAYYDFSPTPEYRVVVLDGYDISAVGWPEDHPKTLAALKILDEKNPNSEKNSPEGLVGVERRFVKYNGGVGEKQLEWLDGVLKDATESNQRVIVCGHVPMSPGCASSAALLWNFDEVMSVIHKYDVVKVCLSGHDHKGGYFVDSRGVHHRSLEAALECPPGTYSFGCIDVYENKLSLVGTDRMLSTDFEI
ncbi:unnamed protein product [Brassica oleracea]|uniref:Manganese-dependent ADP-ribose/CDP-alcohol diphosphatase n=3 Tax=Brassica TaxID=3705 RepID=A0A0D3A619_BRAOL|nr:unnamed protein product [Brassica oleracea]